MKKTDSRSMVLLAMFCALMLVLQITGIGLIPLPLIKATTMHIPVILCAVLMGPKAGAVLGAVFGLCSIWGNIQTPALLSFAFSPILAFELCGVGGLFASLWTALGCRILLGLVAGWLWMGLKKLNCSDYLALPLTSALATIFHSLSVMCSIALLFAPQYAEAKEVAVEAVFGMAMGTVATAGVAESVAAVVLVTAIGKALIAYTAKLKKR